ncbi:tetratricopeptide repeat protein [Armatimonas sp.]|uniref:AfsR/SARP family transcriptional regulator n=1 Tax=Armatimonas sp. TaxID=1872638 RepID=UPI00374D94AA
MNEPWSIQLFGGLRVRQAERVITRFRTQKTGALLAFLAYHKQHSHAREVLIELFWPETTPESGRHNLSHALSSLRSLLEPPGVPAGTVLIADRFTVELNPDAFTTDVAQFEQALRSAAQARNTPEHASRLALALEKCTGELLPGYYEDWIEPAQERIRQRFEQAATQLSALQEREATQEAPAPVTAPTKVAVENVLPTGTVTFLFTDIEGSTKLWERVGDVFRSALSTHHALLRHEFKRSGGHEVKEAGDSFLVVFASVGDALACAIACQRALEKQAWPEEIGPLRVRMALHTGDVELAGGEYHGILLHRAARMLSAAHGGQILCSEASSNLLSRDLEPQVLLKDLGIWRLRDIQEPERLFQASYPDMALTEFPPLNASPAHRSHLPLQFTRFFGREAEIAQLVELLASPQTRLLTLTGPGGTGKTRLSLEAAGRFAESFAGVVWFVPLADLSDASLIPTAILQALSIPLSGSKEPLEQALTALQKQPTLLILDNFEQLVEAGGAELVQVLLSRVASLRCLVTSRQLLGLPGEAEFAVSPLATPNGSDTPERLGLFESVRLFVDRAQAAKPDFRITNGNAPAVAELCDRLEGIPLAIELAAARALVLSPSQMLAQLGNRFEFLVSRKRGLAERQRTLRAAIDWSYRLLTPDVQRFFCQLCVFRGGWSLEAAESVCEEPLALDMLAQLRECSLITTVESESGIRFRMLETLREYAESQLSQEELAAVRERYAQFFLAMAEEAKPTFSDRLSRYERLDSDIDNIRAVLDWSLTPEGNPQDGLRIVAKIWSYWLNRGRLSEGCIMLAELIEINYQYLLSNTYLYNTCKCGLGLIYYHKNEYSKSKSVYHEALIKQREVGDIDWIANSLNNLGMVLKMEGDLETAMIYYRESLALHRETGDAWNIGAGLNNLGNAAQALGDFHAAKAFHEESLQIKRTVDDLCAVGAGLNNLGTALNSLGDKVRARELFDEALLIYQNQKDKLGIAWSNANIAILDYESGNFSSALALLKPCLPYHLSVESRVGVADILERLGAVMTPLNHAEKAVRLCSAADRIRIEIGAPLSISRRPIFDREIAAAREALGDDEAFDRAWQEGRAMTLEQAVAYALEELGE